MHLKLDWLIDFSSHATAKWMLGDTGRGHRYDSDNEALIPFDWLWCAGRGSRPLHRHVAGRWVNPRLSAAGRTTEWQHGEVRPQMRQENLKDRSQSFYQLCKPIDSISILCHCSVLTPDGRFDAFVYFNQQVTHTVPRHPSSVKQGL